MPTDFLVTGGSGFLGRQVIAQLAARGERVAVLCRTRVPDLERLGVRPCQGDLRDRVATIEACRGIEIVIHVAGLAGIWGPWREYHATNVQGTLHVLEGCHRHGVGRLVFTSTPSVTFGGGNQANVDEHAPYPRRWLCHYSHSKALAEQSVLKSHRDGLLHTCAVRPHLVWGPGDRQLVPRLIERAKQGRLVRVGSGENLIDMTYVDNAALAHVLAADALAKAAPAGGEAYFISQGEPVRCWEWIDQLLNLAGVGTVSKSISSSLAYVAGGLYEAMYWATLRRSEPPMTRFLAKQLALDHYFRIDKAQYDLGYRPRVSTEEGMLRLGAYLANGGPGG